MPKAKTTPRKPAPKKPAPPPVDLNEVAKLVAANAKAIAEHRASDAEHRAANAELRQSIAHLGTTVQAIEKTSAETAKQLAQLGAIVETIEKVNAETAKQLAQLGVRTDEALAIAKENNRYIGAHATGEGEILEIECYNTLLKMGEINGVKLERLRLGMKDPQYGVEIDLVGINGKVTFPMEVKRTLYPEDVLRFKEVQVERFKEAYPEYALNKQVTPVIIFALRKQKNNKGKKEDPVQLALKAGMIVLQSTGENQLSPITAPAQVTARPSKDKD